MKQASVLLILLVLCGCKAEHNDNFSAATGRTSMENAPHISTPAKIAGPVAPATHDIRPVLACFGDSLTAGYGEDPGHSYPDYLQSVLDSEGYSYHVVNEGVSGETSKDGLVRLSRVLAMKPAVVVVEFGGNDGLRGMPLKATQENLVAMVTKIQASGAKVLLAGISLPPSYGHEYVTRFNAMYPSVAKQTGVALNPFIYKDVYNVPGDIQDDGIHATAQGNQQVAKNIAGSLEPLLKR